MTQHSMVPSASDGYTECQYCGALDTQIKFARDKQCPGAPAPFAKEYHAGDVGVGISIEITEAAMRKVSVAETQAHWFHGYSLRQLARSLQA